MAGEEKRPSSVQRRASLHEKTVKKVAGDSLPKGRRGRGADTRPRTSRVRVASMHPAYRMARALGVPTEHVQITAEGDRWGCVIWNHPAPWPPSQ